MTTVSDPAAAPAAVRPTRPSDVVVALLLIAAELVLGWFTYDIATSVSRHLDATRPVQWFFLALPFLPLAAVVAVRALSPARALAAALAGLGGGVVQIVYYELLIERHILNPSIHQLQALGYAVVMVISVLAALAWGLSRRHGRRWPVGLLVAAAGAALTIRTNWTSHTSWGHTTFASVEGDNNPIRRLELMHAVGVMLPVIAACVVCWLVDVAELRRASTGPTYDEGPPPR